MDSMGSQRVGHNQATSLSLSPGVWLVWSVQVTERG